MIEGKAAAKAELRSRMNLSGAGERAVVVCILLHSAPACVRACVVWCGAVAAPFLVCVGMRACAGRTARASSPACPWAGAAMCCAGLPRPSACCPPRAPRLADVPVVGCVTRLTHQKGIHLIKHAAWRTLERGAQFVLLGSAPDPKVQVRGGVRAAAHAVRVCVCGVCLFCWGS